jgi:hypothetical protein
LNITHLPLALVSSAPAGCNSLQILPPPSSFVAGRWLLLCFFLPFSCSWCLLLHPTAWDTTVPDLQIRPGSAAVASLFDLLLPRFTRASICSRAPTAATRLARPPDCLPRPPICFESP